MDSPSYHDGTLDIDGQTLTIRRYYFPWLGAKHVELGSVRGVQRAPMSLFGGPVRGHRPAPVRRLSGAASQGRIDTTPLTLWLPLSYTTVPPALRTTTRAVSPRRESTAVTTYRNPTTPFTRAEPENCAL